MIRRSSIDWTTYLQAFHAARPGIADELLTRSTAGQHSPYEWLARAVAPRASVVLDLACGSGGAARALERPGRTIVGLDIRQSELQLATLRSRAHWICGDALKMPFADASMDAVVSAMGMVMIHPTEALVAEIARVLKPGGLLAFIAPAAAPLSPADLKVVAAISSRLRTKPRFPGKLELTSFKPVLAAHGLRKVEDAHERYRVAVRSRADAELLISSLYLPTISPRRMEAAISYLERRVMTRGEIAVPIPMRRFVAIK